MRVDVKWRREGDVVIGSVLGRIDSASAGDFQRLVEEGLGPDDGSLVLDLEKVAFMSSAGLRVCLILAKRFGAHNFALCALSELNREVVAVSGFDQLISVNRSQAGAIQAVGGS